jgi:hypothetical protein
MTGIMQILAAGGAAYSAEAEALFAAMTVQPDTTRKGVIDTFIKTMIADGIWAKLDVLWVLRAHDAQAGRLNWKTPASFALTAVNSPTFTVDRGYTGDASTKYLNTNWNYAVNAVISTLNSASIGVYQTPNIGTAGADGSIMAFGGQQLFIRARVASDKIDSRLNGTPQVDSTSAPASRFGLTAVNRADANDITFYRNGVTQGTVAQPSGSPGTGVSLILCYNGSSGLSPQLHNDNQTGLAWVGASLTAGEHAAFDTAFDTYITATT